MAAGTGSALNLAGLIAGMPFVRHGFVDVELLKCVEHVDPIHSHKFACLIIYFYFYFYFYLPECLIPSYSFRELCKHSLGKVLKPCGNWEHDN